MAEKALPVEELQEQLTKTNADLAKAIQLNANLTTENVQLKDSNAELSQKLGTAQVALDTANQNLATATTVIDGQAETITEQEQLLAKYEAAPPTSPTITVDKIKYAVEAAKFQFDGATYTVADLVKNKTLQATLVKKGVGFLRKLD